MAEESTDKALEILSSKYFNFHLQDKPENVPLESELSEMRNDEIAVLESIYDSIFRIKDTHTWSVKINMDYLSKIYEKTTVAKKKENVNFKTKKKEVCKLYLSGSCRFGTKCRFLHEAKVEKVVVEEKKEAINYELEIRFPKDSVYPYELPLIFFKLETRTNLIPERTCLLITARLYEEARNYARDGIPCIYSLVELLNNEDEILNYIQFSTKEFPSATDSLLPQLETIENDIKKPSHYSISKDKDNRPSLNFENIMKENREIAKRYFEKPENNRYVKMMSVRRNLPAWKKRNDILNAMKKSQVRFIFLYKHL